MKLIISPEVFTIFLHCLFIDIDECMANTDGCEQGCTNTDGSFMCTCDSGFTLDSNARTCSGNCKPLIIMFSGCLSNLMVNFHLQDINECMANTDGCEQTCTNTDGSFECSCDSGFVLAGDGRTCMEANECTLGTNNCEQVCVNTPGGFRCECNPGFQLNADQATCSGEAVLFVSLLIESYSMIVQISMSVWLTLMVAAKAVPTLMDRLCVPVTVDSHSLMMEGLVWIMTSVQME